ncbi:MAG: FHA domain-containing protein [Anaerolineae bacterium]|nr:FHA domain-containing protein [Anaerolineae bacterium]
MSLDWILLGLRVLAALILYSFLGLAVYIIWRDLKSAEQIAASQIQYHHLQVLTRGDDQGLVVGDMVPLQPVTYLGRDPDNTIILSDSLASGRHARISRENGVWWLEDLGSTNGTTLNDLPVSKPTSLAHHDRIGLGNLRFQVELGG